MFQKPNKETSSNGILCADHDFQLSANLLRERQSQIFLDQNGDHEMLYPQALGSVLQHGLPGHLKGQVLTFRR